ncbi:MAG: Mfa1 fimbrilin C-terminal domain-containing protein [Muribaculaceae bacterium]|nr:Mfa1 fimbrilin C-terminal domain-containing protein [Muribaculaceae bacterium]
MKLKQILLGSLCGSLLLSCSNDLPEQPGKVMENETTTYVRVSLVSDGFTRAEQYENGSDDENRVNQILLIFFDAGRNYVGRTNLTVTDENTVSTPGTSNTVERMLTMVAPVNLPENINYPKYVVAFVNPTAKYGDLAVDKLEELMTFIRNRADISYNGYRTMNNSLYFSQESGNNVFATEVDFKSQFFETMEDARDAEDATIDITVERMEAKVRLSTPLDAIPQEKPYQSNSGVGADTYTLEFVPEAWFVNGTEKRSFLLKNFRQVRDNYLSGNMPDVDYGMKLNEVQNAFKANNQNNDGRWNYVNDVTNLRSYWAIDPTYFIIADDADTFYPDVSYDVKYLESINPEGRTFPLTYRSYANVLEEQNKHTSTSYVKFNSTVKTHEYVLENTLSYATMNSINAKAAMASVVLLGHYVVKNGAGTVVFDGTTTDKSKSFYVRHEAEANRLVMISDNEAIDFMLERGGSTLFVQSVDKEGKLIPNSYEPLRAAHLKNNLYGVGYEDFELKYPASTTTGGKKLSEQWRTLNIKKNADGAYSNKIFIYDPTQNNGAGGYKNITDADATDLEKKLYATYGVLEKFQTGKAYFNVPLKHIWGVGTTSNKFDPKSVVLGDYGVVRNHVYDLTINKIEGLGTGIGDIEQPIVPPTENEQYYISTRIRVLQWRLVGQSVDL